MGILVPDPPGHPLMFAVHMLTGRSCFGGIRRFYSMLRYAPGHDVMADQYIWPDEEVNLRAKLIVIFKLVGR